ncbi:hypothetical protein [Salinibacterium sp. dk2585]|uniref:hypothetical protein n=2 Tax=unclassified Salinibacterium TaxID=2632331 RepID=UPI001F0FB662|nr:hypothetical protein [Salinibacterium sp. dk2585]
MVTVIGVTSVLVLLVVAATATVLGSQRKSVDDADWNAALAAAYAAIDEYQNRISDEPSYVKYGNPGSEFSNPTGSATATVQLPATHNPAFDLGESGAWATVPGSDDARFRYEVDNAEYAATGTVKLRATGAVGKQTRTIVANLRQTGFIDFLYFTDYEMSDPDVRGMSVNSPASPSCTVIHKWKPGGSTRGCTTIQFGNSDEIKGPLHSNDTMLICAARFEGVVTTGNPSGGFDRPSGCSLPTFTEGAPVYSPSIPMPPTNSELKQETRTDVPDDVPRPGCLYTGPTSIEFLNGGKMHVKSPWTKYTNIRGATGATGDNSQSAQCGTPAQLRNGVTLDVPENNVIYVQNTPLSGPNGASSTDTTAPAVAGGWFTPSQPAACKHATSGNRLTNNLGHSQNVVGYPRTNELPPVSGTDADTSYGCRNGDVFISGQLSGGGVTVAAENYIYITGDLTYQNDERDMLGLVGNNAVWVYNPMRYSSGTPLLGSHRRIDAAILSVSHTFAVQNYNVGGDRGVLTVRGAIAQKFRGPVGNTGPNGYDKDYRYDGRFRYMAPPKFLSPVTTTYGVNVWIEVQPAFNPDGTYR